MMIGTSFLRIMTNEDNAEEVEDDYSDDVIKYLNKFFNDLTSAIEQQPLSLLPIWMIIMMITKIA